MKERTFKYQDEKIVSDPDGSYTGKPIDVGEKPIQDVDDL